MWARYVGHKLHVKGLSSVAQLRKRPTSASHAVRELPKRATSWLCSRENRSQINCTIAMKFKTQTPNPNPIMKRSMNRPRSHTSRVDDFTSSAFVSTGASASVECVNGTTCRCRAQRRCALEWPRWLLEGLPTKHITHHGLSRRITCRLVFASHPASTEPRRL